MGYRDLNINYGGIGVRKGDTDFLNYLDTWIYVNQIKGWLDERKAYWFKSDGWFAEIDKNPMAVKWRSRGLIGCPRRHSSRATGYRALHDLDGLRGLAGRFDYADPLPCCQLWRPPTTRHAQLAR